MNIEEREAQARFNWLCYFNDELKRGDYLTRSQVAEQLGKPETYVEKKHREGALYVQVVPRDYVEKIAAAFPDKMEQVGVAVEFVRQGNEMVYPAWQLREKRKPSNGLKVIRPEIKMAREAFSQYAEELAKGSPEHPFVKEGAIAADRDLVSFFNTTGGCSERALQDHIKRLDKAKPPERMTLEKFKSAWWYHENPFCDFS